MKRVEEEVNAIKKGIENEFPGTIVQVHKSGVDLSCSVPVSDGVSLKNCSFTVHESIPFSESFENALFLVGIIKKAGNA